MSVDFSNVQAGDRIKLTRENGDECTITTTGVGGNLDWVGTGRVVAYSDDWDTLEILGKALPEAPTRTGAMIHNGGIGMSYFIRNSSGEWMNDSGDRLQEKEVRKALRDGWAVVFEGLDYDA